jgi:hypothetical protein
VEPPKTVVGQSEALTGRRRKATTSLPMCGLHRDRLLILQAQAWPPSSGNWPAGDRGDSSGARSFQGRILVVQIWILVARSLDPSPLNCSISLISKGTDRYPKSRTLPRPPLRKHAMTTTAEHSPNLRSAGSRLQQRHRLGTRACHLSGLWSCHDHANHSSAPHTHIIGSAGGLALLADAITPEVHA